MENQTFYVEHDGEKIRCDIISTIKYDEEIYVAFTDYKKINGKDIIQYGKLIENEGIYYLVDFVEKDEIIEILEKQILNDVLNELSKEGNI